MADNSASTAPHAQGHTTSHAPASLLTLPIELRIQIYNYIRPLNHPIHLDTHKTTDKQQLLGGEKCTLSILFVCHQMYADITSELRLVLHGGAALRRFVTTVQPTANVRIEEVVFDVVKERWVRFYVGALGMRGYFGEHELPEMAELFIRDVRF